MHILKSMRSWKSLSTLEDDLIKLLLNSHQMEPVVRLFSCLPLLPRSVMNERMNSVDVRLHCRNAAGLTMDAAEAEIIFLFYLFFIYFKTFS